MLNSMRKYATGWVVKVLFGVLILSFAVWGIGDVLRAPQTGVALAEVAGSEVDQREVMREFDRRYQELQERAGGGLTRQQAVAFGLLNQALDQTIARRLVDAHARELGLTVSEAELAAAIRDNPALTGPTGFDRSRFDTFLRSVGMTERDYVEALRQDTVRGRLVEGVTGAAAAPAVAPSGCWPTRASAAAAGRSSSRRTTSRCPSRTRRRSRPTSRRTRGATRLPNCAT
jgi:peptidyl-prolyl cis-trans isomerase D